MTGILLTVVERAKDLPEARQNELAIIIQRLLEQELTIPVIRY